VLGFFLNFVSRFSDVARIYPTDIALFLQLAAIVLAVCTWAFVTLAVSIM
jgi:hypothetical protein